MLLRPSLDKVYCHLCDSECGRVSDLKRHFRRFHGVVTPKEGKPEHGCNWMRVKNKTSKIQDISTMFSTAIKRPAPTLDSKDKTAADLKKRKTESMDPTAHQALRSVLSNAALEFKAMLKTAISETKRELQTQYGQKLRVQQDTIESSLKQLQKLTADARSQRELELSRELLRLKQKEAIQSDK